MVLAFLESAVVLLTIVIVWIVAILSKSTITVGIVVFLILLYLLIGFIVYSVIFLYLMIMEFGGVTHTTALLVIIVLIIWLLFVVVLCYCLLNQLDAGASGVGFTNSHPCIVDSGVSNIILSNEEMAAGYIVSTLDGIPYKAKPFSIIQEWVEASSYYVAEDLLHRGFRHLIDWLFGR